MKRILVLTLNLLLAITSFCIDNRGKITITATVLPTETGQVQVGVKEATNATVLLGQASWTWPKDYTYSNTTNESVSQSAYSKYQKSIVTSATTGIQYILKASAIENSGYSFYNWTTASKDASISKQNGKTDLRISGTTDASNSDIEHVIFANFRQIITCNQNALTLTKAGATGSVQFNVDLYNAIDFGVSISRTGGQGTGSLSYGIQKDGNDYTVNGSEEENIILKLTAGNGVIDGDEFDVDLTAINGAKHTVHVKVVESVDVTFVAPSKGKGSFTATTASISFTLKNNDNNQSLKLSETQTYTLTAAAADGYRFDRWVIKNGRNTSYKYGTPYPGGYISNNGDSITAEFIEDDYAMFVILGQDNIFYSDLNVAFEEAGKIGKTVVSVYQPGNISYSEITNEYGQIIGTITNSSAHEWNLKSGEYTIPKGYTLLVPGLGKNHYTGGTNTSIDYAYASGNTTENNYISNKIITPISICKLIIPSETTIQVDGNISVYSCMNATQGYTGLPLGYGQIHLKANSHIELNSGSELHVLGYITGDATSSVIANDGSRVYEVFQFRDWRGGSAIAGGEVMNFITSPSSTLINNAKKVFPMGQYYIQNIETKLELRYGSKEYITSAVDVGGTMYPLTTVFIDNIANGITNNGLFLLGNSCVLQKSYDTDNDRLRIKVSSQGSDRASAQMGNIHMDIRLTVFGIEIDASIISKNYVLPINNNMDIEIDNVKLDVPHMFALMAGSTLTITETAQLNVQNELFVYDAELNVQPANAEYGYFGPSNCAIMPVLYSATLNTSPNKRSDERSRYPTQLKDASIIINGTLTMEDSGALYTTTYGNAVKGVTRNSEMELIQDFGANIISTGNGVINFNSIGSKSTTNQIFQGGSEGKTPYFVEDIPVCNAWLRNSDGTREGGAGVSSGTTYMYMDGTWQVPTANLRNPQNNVFTITLPNSVTQDVVCEEVISGVDIINITKKSASGSQFEVGNPTRQDGKITIPVTYKPTGIHNTTTPITGKIVLTINYTDPVTGEKTKDVEIDLSATENYTPNFSVTLNGSEFKTNGTYASQIIGSGVGDTISLPVVIKPAPNNVANTSSIVWGDAASATSLPFSFVYGVDTNTLTEAQLQYTPSSIGENSGTLTILATYTDNNNTPISDSIVISLNAKVDLKENKLAFAAFPDEIFYEDYAIEEIEEPFLLLNAATNTAGTTITPSCNPNSLIEFIGNGMGEPYKVKPLAKGSGTITVVQEAGDKVASTQITKPITIKSRYDQLTAVSFCLEDQDDFDNVTSLADKVVFNTANRTIDFEPSSTWQIQFRCTPDELLFIPTGTNAWRIREKESKDAEWNSIVEWTNTFKSGQQQILKLQPTTRFVQIEYAALTEQVGSMSQFCITKLDIDANVDTLYVPIFHRTQDTSSRTLVLTHTQATTPAITITSPLAYVLPITTSGNLGTVEEPHYTSTITIEAPYTTPENEYVLSATQDDGTSTSVIVRTYNFPQELPIKWTLDNAERYYFTTTDESYMAKWDAKEKELVFLNPGAINIRRYVVFAFNGAPDIIKFDLSTTIDDGDWTIEESEDGKFYTSNLNGRDSLDGNTLIHKLNYKTRYVRVSYSSASTNEVVLSNFVIEGYPHAIMSKDQLTFTTESYQQRLYMIAINLQEVDFEIGNTTAFQISIDTTYASGWTNLLQTNSTTHSDALGLNKVDTVFLAAQWLKTTALDEGTITVTNKMNDSILAVIPLLGSDSYLTQSKAYNTGIYTGVPDGSVDPERSYTFHNKKYTDYSYKPVNLNNAFATDGTALFDYLFIYGETTPSEGNNITAPGVSGDLTGSNAVTPLLVYRKALDTHGEYKGYQLAGKIDNVNVPNKEVVEGVMVNDTASVVHINVENTTLRVYMTGFCPYATTGYTKNQEGVFLFRGTHGAKLDIYLEDFHVFSRNKTENGNAFFGDKEGGEIYSNNYARGSGGVLVFENTQTQEKLEEYQPFDVTIHTMGNNLLSSNYGCFYGLQIGSSTAMKAYQVSSPIQVHMNTLDHARKTKTKLNFDDVWPIALDANNNIIDSVRTNGFLALKKQANNAPSIDMGNLYTEVNFKGGQVELQNSQIGSDTYKTTLAISYRSGLFGADEAGIQLCYGIGSDAVGGVVNFIDGTITVEKMYVAPAYRQYYLMDTLSGGVESDSTSCLRTPKNTYVTGGSVCRIRACQHVTSKGGAPKDTKTGSLLGQYVYTMGEDDTFDPITKLVTKIAFPDSVDRLKDYHDSRNYTYGLKSVTPDANDKLYFWIPDGYGGVTAEKDVFMSTWKACMTKIGAGIPNVAEGSIGGDVVISSEEEVKYFLYCQLDRNIYDVINAGPVVDGKKQYTYKAPIEVPSAAREHFSGDYTRWAPNEVGAELQYQVTTDSTYTIANRIYYITPAVADIWQTFTAPFDVAKIYVVETFSEDSLKNFNLGNRESILQEQAKHNADFAAFFAVAMAMGTMDSFEEIYQSYIEWAKIQDRDSLGIWDGVEPYTLRSMQRLVPYLGRNWREANFYLNENTSNSWYLTQSIDEEGDPIYTFDAQWNMLTDNDTIDGILLHKNKTYSLMFPYCTGCGEDIESRGIWDYWSGKLLVFESKNGKQKVNGRDFLNDTIVGNVFSLNPPTDYVIVTGNSTFSQLQTDKENVFYYEDGYPAVNSEVFTPNSGLTTIYPTTAFLYGALPEGPDGMPVKAITRSGQIVYDTTGNGNNPSTGGNIPTVGGGNDLFITETAGGINIAVAAPQQVRVISSTGAVLYSGMVQTSVDVAIPTTGVYVVTGENEAQKILY